MDVKQCVLTSLDDISALRTMLSGYTPDLLLVFADTPFMADADFVATLQQAGGTLLGCTTAGEIARHEVHNYHAVVTAIRFAQAHVQLATTEVAGMADSFRAGQQVGSELTPAGLQAVFVLGPGLNINGSALISGLKAGLPEHVGISGGLAADYSDFKYTWVLSDNGVSHTGVAALGLYGAGLSVTTGAYGGWKSFGPFRKITRAADNILYELDNQPALDVYKRYLGEYADQLPASGLLFPMEMVDASRTSSGLVRTILEVDEKNGSLTMAGDILSEGYLRLMHASTDDLVEGAEQAAYLVRNNTVLPMPASALLILVSCVGRKLIMGDSSDEEVEAVNAVIGHTAPVCGFYSYGEISPHQDCRGARLHNQTMTVTLIAEQS